MGAAIHTIRSVLPQRVLENIELAEQLGTIDAFSLERRYGVRRRFLADPEHRALDLAQAAAGRLLEEVEGQSIGFLILCTQSPDHLLPTTACILQDRLGLATSIGALDINLGGSGFVHGLELARGLIAAGMTERVLLVTADTFSRYLEPSDEQARALLGDGAAATLIVRSEHEGIGPAVLGSDGSGAQTVMVPGSGVKGRLLLDSMAADGAEHMPDGKDPRFLCLDLERLRDFVLQRVPRLIEETLARNDLHHDDITLCVCHQMDLETLRLLEQVSGFPPDRFFIGIADQGNTVSASVPIALASCLEQGRLSPGDRVLLAGFGNGYSWAGSVVEV